MTSEVLAFDNLDRYLLLKNGNYLYKIPFRGAEAVLKVYFGSRSALRYIGGTIGNYFEGQTSFMPRARRANELRCLKIWRAAGFRVFDTYEEVIVEGLPAGGYLIFEYLPGLKFTDYFGDSTIAAEERLQTWRRFLKEWHRRHRLAIAGAEPRLVHENGDLKHVMLADDRFLYFDFEMTYRSGRRIREYVAREILAYLKSLGKAVGAALFSDFLAATLRHYPATELLAEAHRLMFAHPNPVLRAARAMDRRFDARARKPFSKYNVARQLQNLLSAPASRS